MAKPKVGGKKGHQQWYFIDSKQWLSQTDEMQSVTADLERRTLSKACFTSDNVTRFYSGERRASQNDIKEFNAAL
jgi:hypothetical protein